jgi:hypothetical protein
MGLMALFIATAFGGLGHSQSLLWRGLARSAAVALLVLHLVLAPVISLKLIDFLNGAGALSRRIAASFPADAKLASQTAIVLHPPCVYFPGLAEVIHALEGQPTPARIFTLASSIYPLSIQRTDACTLVVRPDGGFLLRPGSGPPGRQLPRLSPLIGWQIIDWIYRDADEPFPSHPFMRDGIRLEVLEQTDDTRPAAVSFRFPSPLEDPRWRWLRWQEGAFVAFQPPPVGESVRLVSYAD